MLDLPNVLDQTVRPEWAVYNGDSNEIIKGIPDEGIGLTVFSPPFANMYTYSNTPRDMGNSKTTGELMEHFRFLVPELLRITKPGRSCCIHITDEVTFKRDGDEPGLRDTPGEIIRTMQAAGWVYANRRTIDKCPQVKAQRTKDRGLLFKTLSEDSSLCTGAMADYLLQFRKPGANFEPIKAGIHERYSGGKGWITGNEWIEWAAPVWYRRIGNHATGLHDGYPSLYQETRGIKETDVLNVAVARDSEDERHLCPLQLGVIERCVKLWSNPGDIVFDPFTGIGSTGHGAIKLNRRFVGIELKPSYFRTAIKNLQEAEQKAKSGTIWSLLDDEDEEEDELSGMDAEMEAVA